MKKIYGQFNSVQAIAQALNIIMRKKESVNPELLFLIVHQVNVVNLEETTKKKGAHLGRCVVLLQIQ